MSKGAVAVRKAAKQAERRAKRIVAGDSRTRELLDFPVLLALEDWTLVICEGCGLEQGSVAGPCACGSGLATYADADRANEAKLSFRRFEA